MRLHPLSLGYNTSRELPFEGKREKAKLAMPFTMDFESKLNHCLLILRPCLSTSPEA